MVSQDSINMAKSACYILNTLVTTPTGRKIWDIWKDYPRERLGKFPASEWWLYDLDHEQIKFWKKIEKEVHKKDAYSGMMYGIIMQNVVLHVKDDPKPPVGRHYIVGIDGEFINLIAR